MPSDLEIPRFTREVLNPHIAPAQDGEAFQQLVAELLQPEYPDLHAYPAGGRDGGIDLAWPADTAQIFFECKHIAEDGLEATEARWREIEDRLRRHLADPVGPGQSQYGPWYTTDPPVQVYTLCLSSLLLNHSQRKKLRARIREFFVGLAEKHPHLRHLAAVEVRIRDWEHWRSLLAARPHVLFRWFPTARPRGLLPLDTDLAGTGFREYLAEGRLPYYSRREHKTRVPPPIGVEIPSEEEILADLDGQTFTGLVITGGGGLGKTRLMLEFGRLATSHGWTVLRVQGRVREDSLERLAERMSPDTPALLLIDYIETQPDYGTLIETLNLLIDERHLPLRYIACCRSSFYPTVQGIGRHRRIDLSPQGSGAAAWLEGFRNATVRHIAERTGLPSPERIEAMSRATPVLAVFAAWLQAQGKKEDLVELLGEPDFGTWVHKRVRQSFGIPTISRDLARFVALLPLNDTTVNDLDANSQALLDRLALDGWVSRQPVGLSDELRWETTHDVLADQVTLSYLETAPATTRAFVQELFETAASLGAIVSVVTALQRIGGATPLQKLPWRSLFEGAMEQHPEAWREARLLAIRSPLLSVEDRALLLGSGDAVWDGIEADINFQNSLGWLVRELSGREMLDEKIRGLLRRWLRRTAPHVEDSNYLLTKGLRFSSADVRNEALRWMYARPAEFQTHYLLFAWLSIEKDAPTVQYVIEQWLARFRLSVHANFVFNSWFRAGGNRELIRPYIRPWLYVHKEKIDAMFVMTSWLNSGGDHETVQPFLTPWLSAHGDKLEAEFVFQSWLDAGGDSKTVQSFITPWLKAHGEKLEARFVLKSWLNAGGDHETIQPFITPWLAAHGDRVEAEFIFKFWLDAGGDHETVQPFITPWLAAHGDRVEAEFIFKSWLDAGGEHETVQPFIKPWLQIYGESPQASFILRLWLQAGGDFDLVRESACRWLNAHRESPEADFLLKYLTRQRDLSESTVRDILAWCRKFCREPDALWRFTSLENHLLRKEIAEEVIDTSKLLLEVVLSLQSFSSLTSGVLCLLFAVLGESPLLRAKTGCLFLRWLRHPSSYSLPPSRRDGTSSRLHLRAQSLSTLFYVRDLIKSGDLFVVSDRDALLRLFAWIGTWRTKTLAQARPFLEELVRASGAPKEERGIPNSVCLEHFPEQNP